MISVSPLAQQLRGSIDAVVFDMDGVLLDITYSIRVVNCLAVPFYLRDILKWPADDTLLNSDDIELFKNAGGFNDDWDLTYALVLHYLVKGHEHPDDPPSTLNVLPPSLRRYTALIKERGGWIHSAEDICLENLSPQDRKIIETQYRKPIIKQVFQEMMGGEHCERLYGFRPTYYRGPAYINNDRPLLELDKLPQNLAIGVQTGRTIEEAAFGLEQCELLTTIPQDFVITKSDGFQKPEPGGLRLLAERMKLSTALYIGDTIDDLRTVKNVNSLGKNYRYLSAQVLTGPAGAVNEAPFRNAGADIVASTVNDVLDWLTSGVVQ